MITPYSFIGPAITEAEDLTLPMNLDAMTIDATGRTKLDLNPHRRGDTWPGIDPVTVTDSDGVPIDLTGATITMSVKRSKSDRAPLLTWSTAGGTITITDGPAGQFTIQPRVVDLTGRSYQYDVQCVLADGTITTVLHGCWSIADDVTR